MSSPLVTRGCKNAVIYTRRLSLRGARLFTDHENRCRQARGPTAGAEQPKGLTRPRLPKTSTYSPPPPPLTHTPPPPQKKKLCTLSILNFSPFPRPGQISRVRFISRFHYVFLLENTSDDIVTGRRWSRSGFMENPESVSHKGFSWTFQGSDSNKSGVFCSRSSEREGIFFSVPVSWS